MRENICSFLSPKSSIKSRQTRTHPYRTESFRLEKTLEIVKSNRKPVMQKSDTGHKRCSYKCSQLSEIHVMRKPRVRAGLLHPPTPRSTITGTPALQKHSKSGLSLQCKHTLQSLLKRGLRLIFTYYQHTLCQSTEIDYLNCYVVF